MKANRLLALAMVIVMAISIAGVTWSTPTDGQSIVHGNEPIALEVVGVNPLGTPSFEYLYSADGVTNRTIVTTNGNTTWLPSGVSGSTQLSVIENNGSVTDASTITVNIKAFGASDLPKVVIDFVVTYLAQFVVLAGLIALVVLLIWFRKRGNFGIAGF